MSEQSRTDLEKHVEAIWEDVLDTAAGGPDATFFELNGQSIAAFRIVARISDRTGIDVPVEELFKDPTRATFARAVLARAERR
ncbi:phosphopantetheine-binding protein [Micromonospora profundi]|uniref:Phosphopantetheine-binding protein n=1 Tax=Micromonospora profundi TaxID=1420889 RepID=A0AAJ6HRQ3_9ACTN|nr:phosphopantetheine-binding protein [Micromonospora profundi]WLS43373.1 phosphopantetheine-binding protein [Micromonospora profundi]